jgi:hypothetical protein
MVAGYRSGLHPVAAATAPAPLRDAEPRRPCPRAAIEPPPICVIRLHGIARALLLGGRRIFHRKSWCDHLLAPWRDSAWGTASGHPPTIILFFIFFFRFIASIQGARLAVGDFVALLLAAGRAQALGHTGLAPFQTVAQVSACSSKDGTLSARDFAAANALPRPRLGTGGCERSAAA